MGEFSQPFAALLHGIKSQQFEFSLFRSFVVDVDKFSFPSHLRQGLSFEHLFFVELTVTEKVSVILGSVFSRASQIISRLIGSR